jgi:hypothetical protein
MNGKNVKQQRRFSSSLLQKLVLAQLRRKKYLESFKDVCGDHSPSVFAEWLHSK